MRKFEREVARLEIGNVSRIEAVDDAIPIRGCTLSHVTCLRLLLEHEWPCVMVCEDDLRFTVGRDELDALVDAFLDDPAAEVACLAYSHREVERHSVLYLRATATQTAACYLVKSTIAAELVDLWEEGAAALAAGGDRHTYGIDRVWERLQRERVFVIPIVRAGRQAAGYSDVWQHFVDPVY